VGRHICHRTRYTTGMLLPAPVIHEVVSSREDFLPAYQADVMSVRHADVSIMIARKVARVWGRE
jgi:hypothetical protein